MNNTNTDLSFIERYEKECFNHSFNNIDVAKEELEKKLEELKLTIFNSNDVKRLRQSFIENAIDAFIADFINRFNWYVMTQVDVNNVGNGFVNPYQNTSKMFFQFRQNLPKKDIKSISSSDEMKKYLVDYFFKNFCSDKEISSMVKFQKEALEIPLDTITNICKEKLNQLKIENSFLSEFDVSCSCLFYNSGGIRVIDLRFNNSFTFSF